MAKGVRVPLVVVVGDNDDEWMGGWMCVNISGGAKVSMSKKQMFMLIISINFLIPSDR